MTYLYKWMLPGLITPTQNKPWPVKVGALTPKKTPILCESGWHGVLEKDVLEHLPKTVGAELWIVQTEGAVVHGNNKFCAEQMRLVQKVGTTDERNLRLFACDCAEDALSLVGNPDPRSVAAIEASRRYAVGDATDDELYAAESAARSAARSAAGSAAWSAAGSAARYAAESAAEYAAIEKYSNWLAVRLWEDR